jgi:hypothetical protein
MSTGVGCNNVVAHVCGRDSVSENWVSNSSVDVRWISTASTIRCILRTVKRLENYGRIYTQLEKTNLMNI